MQSIYLLSLLCISSQLVYNLKHMYQMPRLKDYETLDFGLLLGSHIGPVILMLVIWFSTLPVILTKLTLVTNIEMMKDPQLIENVIAAQKLAKSKRSHRIFQVMKLIRRELAQELHKQLQDKRLRGVTKKHIVESFQAVGGPTGNRTKTIKEDAIRSLVRMCGHVLNI